MATLCCDPGLRNLSLCIMNENYQILLWDVYNILDSDNHHCQSFFKNGKICNRKCTMKYLDNGIQVFCCKTHFPKDIAPTKRNDFKKKNIDDYLLQDIAFEFLGKIQQIYTNNKSIFDSLSSVLIELQPKINPRMSFISHILYGKFVEFFGNRIPIRFIRASLKLRAYTGPPIVCKLKGTYAQRKWLSIQYTIWFLENRFSPEQKEKWLQWYMSHAIKPDMGDTFLMSINSITGIPKKQMTNKKGKCIK